MPHDAQQLTPALIRLYLGTEYLVQTPLPFVLSIGQPCIYLPELFAEHQAQTAAVLTAANPFGYVFGTSVNAGRTARLREHLDNAGLRWVGVSAEGRGPAWPPEAGFLVFGVTRAQVRALMVEFEQNAAVWVEDDTIGQLILHPKAVSIMTPPGDG